MKKRMLLLKEKVVPLETYWKFKSITTPDDDMRLLEIVTEHEKKSATETNQSTKHHEQVLSVQNAFLRNSKSLVSSMEDLKNTWKVSTDARRFIHQLEVWLHHL